VKYNKNSNGTKNQNKNTMAMALCLGGHDLGHFRGNPHSQSLDKTEYFLFAIKRAAKEKSNTTLSYASDNDRPL